MTRLGLMIRAKTLFLNLVFTVKRAITIFFLILSFLGLQAQVEKRNEDVKLYYRGSNSYGLTLHTQGWGISYKKQVHLSYKLKRIYNFEFQNLKHPKQEKVVNNFFDDSKGYYFGKINSLSHLRIGIGQQHAFASKEIRKGVQLAWVYGLGLNLGLMKPSYIEYFVDPTEAEVVRYDPSIHSPGLIRGRAGFFKGMNEIDLVPGIYGKFGLNFEYSPYDEKLKSMEVGVAVDWFYKEVPLMYDTYNKQYWITLYLMLEIGKKIE